MPDLEEFDAGDLLLQSGVTLRDAKLRYVTYGELNGKKNNVVILPTYYGGTHEHYSPLIGAGKALDPTKYFIVIPNMFGNGVSSSPSNTPEPFNQARFPVVTAFDNVKCQQKFLEQKFGIEEVALVAGFSMGAQQSFQWGAIFPDRVRRLLPWCGSAKTSHHNFVFLEGIRVAITTDQEWRGGWYDKPPKAGLRAMARVYAGWFASQDFYRAELFREMGASSVEDFLVMQEGRCLMGDANNFLAMLETWQRTDISSNELYNGDLVSALRRIKSKAIIMPCETDLYFPKEDNELEASHMPNAELRPIPSVWGHMAGSPGSNKTDTAFLNTAISDILLR